MGVTGVRVRMVLSVLVVHVGCYIELKWGLQGCGFGRAACG